MPAPAHESSAPAGRVVFPSSEEWTPCLPTAHFARTRLSQSPSPLCNAVDKRRSIPSANETVPRLFRGGSVRLEKERVASHPAQEVRSAPSSSRRLVDSRNRSRSLAQPPARRQNRTAVREYA